MPANQMTAAQWAMLIGGAALFVVAVSLLIYLTMKKRPTKPALILLPFAILMIGFPSIKNFKGLGFELDIAVQLVEAKARDVEENPEDKASQQELRTTLSKIEANVSTNTASAETAEAIAKAHEALGNPEKAIQWAGVALARNPGSQSARVVLDRARVSASLPATPTQPLKPAERSNLTAAATQLGSHPTLQPLDRAALARAQLALGQTNAARTNLQRAVAENPRIRVSPDLARRMALPPR